MTRRSDSHDGDGTAAQELPPSAQGWAPPGAALAAEVAAEVAAAESPSSAPLVPVETGPVTEAVLAKAIELADQRLRPTDVANPGEWRRVVDEVAAELAIPPGAVTAAIAEELSGVDEVGLLDRIVGPGLIWSRRSTPVDDADAEDRLIEWLEYGHGLRVRRRADGSVVALKRKDLAGRIGRTVRSAQGTGELSQRREVVGVVVPPSGGEGAVVLAADVTDTRRGAIASGAAVTASGAAALAVGTVVFGPLVWLGLPVAATAGVGVSRAVHRSKTRTVEHGVEDTLDQVVRREEPPAMLDPVKRSVTRSLGKVLKPRQR